MANANSSAECITETVTKSLQDSSDYAGESFSYGTQATALRNLSEEDVIKKVGALFTEDHKKSGILASVSLAQFLLESGYGKSELAQNANNTFGMKCSLSRNTWSGSSWDGKSRYTKKTLEQRLDGSVVTITADFRKYPCIEDSIADHSAYLLGAKKGSKPRYDGLMGCTDYNKAVLIIRDGGYATSLRYVEKLIFNIERWNLTQYDAKDSDGDVLRWYFVRKSRANAKSRKGVYNILEDAKKCADQNPGYKVFDADGRLVYKPRTPFLKKVRISILNIRK